MLYKTSLCVVVVRAVPLPLLTQQKNYGRWCVVVVVIIVVVLVVVAVVVIAGVVVVAIYAALLSAVVRIMWR